MITRAKVSVVRASECRTYLRAVLNNFFVPDAALIQVNTVLLVCIHSSSILILPPYSVSKVNKVPVMTLSTSFFSFFISAWKKVLSDARKGTLCSEVVILHKTV